MIRTLFLTILTLLMVACDPTGQQHTDTAPIVHDTDTDTEVDTDVDTSTEADTELDTEAPRFCDASDQCDSGELCFYGRCDEEYGHEFDVTINRGEVWITADRIDDPPGLYVVYGHLTESGYDTDACTTATIENLIFRWNEQCRFTFDEDETFVIDVWETTENDAMLLTRWQWVGDEILDLAEGAHVPVVLLESPEFELTIYIDPVHP